MNNCLNCKFLQTTTKDLTHARLVPSAHIGVQCNKPLQQRKTTTNNKWPDFLIRYTWLQAHCNSHEPKDK